MSVRSALRAAVGETYRCSWRLLVVNTAVCGVLCAVVIIVSSVPLALLLAPLLAGPLVAALVHCTIKLIDEDEFCLADAFEGLRLYWRRGFVLGGLFGFGLLLGVLAVVYYSSEAHRALPLAIIAAYVLAIFSLIVLVAWPLAIAHPGAPVSEAFRGGVSLLLQTPLRFLALGAALLFVNLLGVVTVLPFLTLTLAYSFLAAAHVVLPGVSIREGVTT